MIIYLCCSKCLNKNLLVENGAFRMVGLEGCLPRALYKLETHLPGRVKPFVSLNSSACN